MPREISDALKMHIAQDSLTIALLVKIDRKDNTVIAFTNHQEDVTFDSQLYSSIPGFEFTEVKKNSNLSVDNAEILGIIDATNITDEDVNKGLYDQARVTVSIFNYEDITQHIMTIIYGVIGRITLRGGQYIAEVRGLSELLQHDHGRVYTPLCDAILGDTRCGVNLSTYTHSGIVSGSVNRYSFEFTGITTQADGYFDLGLVTWTSGLNTGVASQLKSYRGNTIVLFSEANEAIAIGDQFSITAGCDRTVGTCRTKFNNIVNFRGFPSIPGEDAVLRRGENA